MRDYCLKATGLGCRKLGSRRQQHYSPPKFSQAPKNLGKSKQAGSKFCQMQGHDLKSVEGEIITSRRLGRSK